MKAGEILDRELEEVLGTAAHALRAWGTARGLRWILDQRLTEGQSGAVVAFVFELDQHAGATKLLMKVDSCPDIELDRSEFARHRAALREAPAEFARLHLTALASEGHDLVAVGDGRWIVFQRIAAMPVDDVEVSAEIHDLDVLSKALACISGPVPVTCTSTEEQLSCTPGVFVGFCAHVVRTVLHDWAGKPQLEPMNAVRYLEGHLLSRLDGGQPLRVISGLLDHDWLLVGDDREPQPNPFILLRDDGPGESIPVKALLGPAHGDLHTGNLLVPVFKLTENAPFRLIDLAKYDPNAPLARDAAGLLLHVVVRVLRYLDESAQEAIARLLLCREEERVGWAEQVPEWLADLAADLRAVGERWAHQHVQLSDWRPQWRLSLLGCALILLGRRSTRTADRMWLLRFAARATRAALGPAHLPARAGATPVSSEMLVVAPLGRRAQREESWVEWLCEYWPRLSRKADEHAVRAELNGLRQAARNGEDRAEEFLRLVWKIDGKAFTSRGDGSDIHHVDEVFTCPLPDNRCVRTVRPLPGDDQPRCALRPGGMRHEFW
jgi:hypothetical protein